jgi:hypothetical protein
MSALETTPAQPKRRLTPRIFLAGAVLVAASLQALLLFFAFQFWALNRPQEPALPPSAITMLPVPPGDYWNVAWMQEESIVVGRYIYTAPGRPGYPPIQRGRLWKLHPDGTDMQMLPLPEHPGCFNTNFRAPLRLYDGRLAYVAQCYETPDSTFDLNYMMTYDLQTGEVSKLRKDALPEPRLGVTPYTWNPEVTRGVVGNGNGLSEGLYWITRDGWQPLPLLLGRAFLPAWSPDGERIAFWGVPEPGVHDINRAKVDLNLYMMDPTGQVLGTEVEGFKYPFDMSWSADSRHIAFIAGEGSSEGIWLLKVGSKKARLIARGDYSAVDWSPDGKELIAIVVPDPDRAYRQRRLVKIDVQTLIEPIDTER